MDKLRTTNILLLIIALPVLFFVLKMLSFIFIPLAFSLFIAILLWPLIRWLQKKKIPKFINITIVVVLMLLFMLAAAALINMSTKEILSSNTGFFEKADTKISNLVLLIEDFFQIERADGTSAFRYYLEKVNYNSLVPSVVSSVKNLLSMFLMTMFFAVLLLSESLNLHDVLQKFVIKKRFASIRVIARVEKDVITFIKVKFILSFFTGLGFTIACLLFDVSFPIFWGLVAFSLNFVQMIGSVVAVILMSIFGLIEINSPGTLLFFVLVVTMVEVVIGGLLEPIFMGKSFAINVITILVMLMFWGFLWGVPGMILSIPITVFLKIIFDQFPKTKLLSSLMAGK